MSFKSQFELEEWRILQLSPMWVFMLVAAVDGVVDKDEQRALFSVTKNAHKFKNELIREILFSLKDDHERISKMLKPNVKKIRQGLEKVEKIADRNLDMDIALDFKKSLIAIGLYVAQSSGSDVSFKASQSEVDRISEIAFILGLDASDLQKKPTVHDIMNKINL